MRMKNLACARAFAVWSDSALEAARLRRGMEKVLATWCNRHTSMAMMRWQAYVQELVRSRQVLAKVIGRWTMRTLAACWDEWTRKIPLRKIVNNIIMRMIHRTVSMALRTWEDHAKTQRKMRETAVQTGKTAEARRVTSWTLRYFP